MESSVIAESIAESLSLTKATTNLSMPSYLTQQPTNEAIHTLRSFLQHKKKLVVITGAGLSTSSGVPDYRGPEGSYKLGHKPMVHDEFMSREASRKRYWARSMVGWKEFAEAKPNPGHYAIANLELKGYVSSVITQNVDRLHHKSGSRKVIELHGRNDRVKCNNCDLDTSRKLVQQNIEDINPSFVARINNLKLNSLTRSERESVMRADGDAELGITDFTDFIVPTCPRCGTGILKPDVVFFGDSVPRDRVLEAFQHVDECDGLLVVGTSLEVYSAYKFILKAAEKNKLIDPPLEGKGPTGPTPLEGKGPTGPTPAVPIAICNLGETRAERMKLPGIVFKSEANCALLLKAVVDSL
eukprot:CAMPEP_0119033410 /NCGR_PEP_ID=MMETSP1177-20130426/449_1 /TAXON_ID=2985 /ORGANISM="Ochromonas sp, Strain CCMP1899" /LENGTH=355 /DNA_ID=CAMNT_0006990135 /DNA_START=271 /DNA_END=1338 /DNA_ORIENTATION=-